MLNHEGGTLDDLTCYRLAEDRYMLVVNAGTAAKDAAWITGQVSGDTRFTDRSADLAKLDVQGPQARDVLEDVLGCSLPDLGYFRFREFEAEEASFILSRTGYTGEWGYEIYLPVASVLSLWRGLTAHESCEPAGLGARDTLRLEMGYPLYGHELAEHRSPALFSRGAFINLQKDFIGRAQTEQALRDPSELLVGLRFDSRRAAREEDKVYFGDTAVGEVTSGSAAPSLGAAVAVAYVAAAFVEEGRELQVEIRGRTYPATVVARPFYTDGTARKKPPQRIGAEASA
jgi:aminomethyltransferase